MLLRRCQTHHHQERPNDQRQHTNNVFTSRISVNECTGVHVKWRRPNIAVNDSDALVREKEQLAAFEDLFGFVITRTSHTRVFGIVVVL